LPYCFVQRASSISANHHPQHSRPFTAPSIRVSCKAKVKTVQKVKPKVSRTSLLRGNGVSSSREQSPHRCSHTAGIPTRACRDEHIIEGESKQHSVHTAPILYSSGDLTRISPPNRTYQHGIRDAILSLNVRRQAEEKKQRNTSPSAKIKRGAAASDSRNRRHSLPRTTSLGTPL
jgi:hypothetical protein